MPTFPTSVLQTPDLLFQAAHRPIDGPFWISAASCVRWSRRAHSKAHSMGPTYAPSRSLRARVGIIQWPICGRPAANKENIATAHFLPDTATIEDACVHAHAVEPGIAGPNAERRCAHNGRRRLAGPNAERRRAHNGRRRLAEPGVANPHAERRRARNGRRRLAEPGIAGPNA